MSDTAPANVIDYAKPHEGRTPMLLRALRHRNYRLFFAGQLVSLVGTFLTQVATLWLVYSMTHKAWVLGVVGFAGQIPMFVLAPFAGVWADRVNRQKLLVATQTLAMVQSFALAYLALTHLINVPEIIALSVFQGLVNAVDIPARQAFVVEMVTDRTDLANAIALNSMMVHGARLIGPALAGLLIGWVGAGLCFLLDGVSYVAVIAALIAMSIAPRVMPAPRSVFADLLDGFRYVWNFAPIRALLVLMAVFSLTGMPAFSILMPIFGDFFGGPAHGAQTLGLLMTASGGGGAGRIDLSRVAAHRPGAGPGDRLRSGRVWSSADGLLILTSSVAFADDLSRGRVRHDHHLRVVQHVDTNLRRRQHAGEGHESLRSFVPGNGSVGQSDGRRACGVVWPCACELSVCCRHRRFAYPRHRGGDLRSGWH